MPVKTVNIQTNLQRALLLIGALVSVVAVFYSVRWSFGHTIAARAEQKEVAELSSALAPGDPQTHYASAVLHEKSFLAEDFEKAVASYERAAALSPNDYLLFLALGKARERNGDPAGAEKALRRAAHLAPNYALVRWTLGNHLLRQGKIEEGFGEIKRAAETRDQFVNPAIATAWDIFAGDVARVRQSLGPAPKMNLHLIYFLVNQDRYDAAQEIWNEISEKVRSAEFEPQLTEIYNRLINKKKYHLARQVRSTFDPSFYAGFSDGGFENDAKKQKSDFFDWKIGDGAQPLIGFDDRIRHGGNLSLVIIFNSGTGRDFRNVSQVAAVEPGKAYVFEGFYRSELKAAGTFRWEILNAADGALLAATGETAENAEWTRFGAEFTAPPGVEAVIVRLARVKCPATICPITGKIWFDDFSLKEK